MHGVEAGWCPAMSLSLNLGLDTAVLLSLLLTSTLGIFLLGARPYRREETYPANRIYL